MIRFSQHIEENKLITYTVTEHFADTLGVNICNFPDSFATRSLYLGVGICAEEVGLNYLRCPREPGYLRSKIHFSNYTYRA